MTAWTPTDVAFVIGAVCTGITALMSAYGAMRAQEAKHEAAKASETAAVAVHKLVAQDVATVATVEKLDTIQSNTNGVISELQQKLSASQVELAVARAQLDETRRLLQAQATQRRSSDTSVPPRGVA